MARILIVDDDELTVSIIAEFLSDQGHDCTVAVSMAQACQHLHRKAFELTISDFNMPSKTGLDLLRYVSSNWPAISFILISGETTLRLRKEALSLGAVACLAKPFKLQELLKGVEDALQRRSALHANDHKNILRRPEDTRSAADLPQREGLNRRRKAIPGDLVLDSSSTPLRSSTALLRGTGMACHSSQTGIYCVPFRQ